MKRDAWVKCCLFIVKRQHFTQASLFIFRRRTDVMALVQNVCSNDPWLGGKAIQSPKSAAILRILTLTPNLSETFLSYCRNYQVGTRLPTCQLQQRMLHQLLQTNHKLHWEMFLQVRMSNKFRIYAYFKILFYLSKLFSTGPHYVFWSKLS